MQPPPKVMFTCTGCRSDVVYRYPVVIEGWAYCSRWCHERSCDPVAEYEKIEAFRVTGSQSSVPSDIVVKPLVGPVTLNKCTGFRRGAFGVHGGRA